MNRVAAFCFPILSLALHPAWAAAAEHRKPCSQALALEKKAYRQVANFQRSWDTETFNQWRETFLQAKASYLACVDAGEDRTHQVVAMGLIRTTVWIGFWWENAALGAAGDKGLVSDFDDDREQALRAYHLTRQFLSKLSMQGWEFTQRADWERFSTHYTAWLAKATDRVDTLTDEKASFTKVSAENDQAWNLLPDALEYPLVRGDRADEKGPVRQKQCLDESPMPCNVPGTIVAVQRRI